MIKLIYLIKINDVSEVNKTSVVETHPNDGVINESKVVEPLNLAVDHDVCDEAYYRAMRDVVEHSNIESYPAVNDVVFEVVESSNLVLHHPIDGVADRVDECEDLNELYQLRVQLSPLRRHKCLHNFRI